jgi:acetyl-CoA acyltransferase
MYSGTRADDLMVRAMRGLLERNPKVSPDAIEDVAIAAATQTGDQGMNLGRSASLLAGLPVTVPGYSVDRWCAGAMTSMTTLAGAIAFGSIDIAIAGGVEHMGNHPIGDGLDPNPRFLAERIVEQDALAMGATAERLHDRFPQLTKERADRYAYNSQMKTAAAYAAGKIQRDLIPTAARIPEMGWGIATVDEPPRPTTTMEGLATLKTPFRPAGRVTPGNSSGLEPEVMGFGPVPSTIKALAKAGLKIEDIGAFEVNEAFAVQVIAFLDHFGIADDDPRVNPYGGAIAVGHPLASSGIRLALNLARAFEEHPEVRYGLTTMCIGLGMGGTVIWENPHFSGGSK